MKGFRWPVSRTISCGKKCHEFESPLVWISLAMPKIITICRGKAANSITMGPGGLFNSTV